MKSKKKNIQPEESTDEEDILDSDDELQKAFQRGDLQSGTYKEITPREKFINDVAGLETRLKIMNKSELDWLERLDVTTQLKVPEEEEGKERDIQDDFQRELQFYTQAREAALMAIPKLHRLHIPTKRPDDYFAQMVKSDEHMRKVREKLLSTSLSAERSEKAKKMRELKKMGKKVQVEVLKSRQKEKREMLEQVKKYRKGQQDKLDFLEGDMEKPDKGKGNSKKSHPNASHPNASHPNASNMANKKREWKNKKFGFGGQKKRSKSNTKESSNDSRDFSATKNSRLARTKGKGKKTAMRPGKTKRQQMKNKRK